MRRPQAVSHSSSWPVATLMGTVPSSPLPRLWFPTVMPVLAAATMQHMVGWLHATPECQSRAVYCFTSPFSALFMRWSTSPCGWTLVCIFVTCPRAEVKPRPSDERVGFWPWGHQGGLWLRLSRCWKGLICLGECVGWLQFPRAGTPHPGAAFAKAAAASAKENGVRCSCCVQWRALLCHSLMHPRHCCSSPGSGKHVPSPDRIHWLCALIKCWCSLNHRYTLNKLIHLFITKTGYSCLLRMQFSFSLVIYPFSLPIHLIYLSPYDRDFFFTLFKAISLGDTEMTDFISFTVSCNTEPSI